MAGVPVSPAGMIKSSPFRYFKASPEIIRLAVMLYMRYPLAVAQRPGAGELMMQCFEHNTGIAVDDLKQRASGAFGYATAGFPVADSA